ncbi:MAG TPA: 4-hydroxyphenylacetate 3-hydroxylase N-terminal domain-containing protein, partial [Pseudonocardia sp.]|uniref:4-hydroxyphenylacetate 3-hydroxylase N-terminal domain-containing protein n=1 Tax=Pseudonocardia sp. TaxID=60912 RepID=UPI002CD6CDEC
MIRTGQDYLDSLAADRDVWVDGERVKDIANHPAFAPIVGLRARIYDMAHEAATQDVLSYVDEQTGERNSVANKLPKIQQDWVDKRAAV